MSIEGILKERGPVHGDYGHMAYTIKRLRVVLEESPNWHSLSSAQQHALEMICTKMGRIMTGDPHFLDHWVDIVGYGQLAVNAVMNAPQTGGAPTPTGNGSDYHQALGTLPSSRRY